MTGGDLAIELRGLRKTWRGAGWRGGGKVTVAVDGLDLDVRRGEVFGLLGPNGAGKTTTVEICEGLTVPDGGSVTVLGRRWGGGDDQALRQRLGVCLQESKFHEKATVRETLRLFASFYPGGRAIDEVLALVSLQEKADARQSALSGGQRQRLAVATALLGRPELLFLDEPTTGLDPQSRRQLWDVVRGFRRDGGTVVLTTHYMDEAQQLCDRVAIVDHGKVIALGTPVELIRSLGAEHCIDVDVEPGALGARVTAADLQALPGVQQCECDGARASLTVASVHRALPAMLELLAARGVPLRGLATRHATLEDVFVRLTGRHLRDEGAQ
ncbi:MAG: ABC transporter ATP-binding protein [Planctomycetes bacterium]|nr:ABC transporter ATP-binding protein [Planctomycetota bacterium]